MSSGLSRNTWMRAHTVAAFFTQPFMANWWLLLSLLALAVTRLLIAKKMRILTGSEARTRRQETKRARGGRTCCGGSAVVRVCRLRLGLPACCLFQRCLIFWDNSKAGAGFSHSLLYVAYSRRSGVGTWERAR